MSITYNTIEDTLCDPPGRSLTITYVHMFQLTSTKVVVCLPVCQYMSITYNTIEDTLCGYFNFRVKHVQRAHLYANRYLQL